MSRKSGDDTLLSQDETDGWLSNLGLGALAGIGLGGGTNQALAAPREHVPGYAITPFPTVGSDYNPEAPQQHVGPNSLTRFEAQMIPNGADIVEALNDYPFSEAVAVQDRGEAEYAALAKVFPWLRHDSRRFVYVLKLDTSLRNDHKRSLRRAYDGGNYRSEEITSTGRNTRDHLDPIFTELGLWPEFQANVIVNTDPESAIDAEPTEVRFLDMFHDGSPAIGVHRRGLGRDDITTSIFADEYVIFLSNEVTAGDSSRKLAAYTRADETIDQITNSHSPLDWWQGLARDPASNYAPEHVTIPAQGAYVTAWSVLPDDETLKDASTSEARDLFAHGAAVTNLEESIINELASHFHRVADIQFYRALKQFNPNLTIDETNDLHERLENLSTTDIAPFIETELPGLDASLILSELPERREFFLKKAIMRALRDVTRDQFSRAFTRKPKAPTPGLEDTYSAIVLNNHEFDRQVTRYIKHQKNMDLTEARAVLEEIRRSHGEDAANTVSSIVDDKDYAKEHARDYAEAIASDIVYSLVNREEGPLFESDAPSDIRKAVTAYVESNEPRTAIYNTILSKIAELCKAHGLEITRGDIDGAYRERFASNAEEQISAVLAFRELVFGRNLQYDLPAVYDALKEYVGNGISYASTLAKINDAIAPFPFDISDARITEKYEAHTQEHSDSE
jgi:hypothetical protein